MPGAVQDLLANLRCDLGLVVPVERRGVLLAVLHRRIDAQRRGIEACHHRALTDVDGEALDFDAQIVRDGREQPLLEREHVTIGIVLIVGWHANHLTKTTSSSRSRSRLGPVYSDEGALRTDRSRQFRRADAILRRSSLSPYGGNAACIPLRQDTERVTSLKSKPAHNTTTRFQSV